MAARPTKLCPTPGCPHFVTGGYCPSCKRRRVAQNGRGWTLSRQLAKRFYCSPRWRALRLLFLNTHPTCTVCGRPANEVDHVTDRRALELAGADQFDEGNLQALCRECHSRKTMRTLRDTRPEFSQKK